jgi:hypothetical protein
MASGRANAPFHVPSLQQTHGFLRCACRPLALDSPPARVTFLHYQQDRPAGIHSTVGHRRKMRTMDRCKQAILEVES